jgi:large subunit ribosomal protein L37Ae
MPTAARYGSIKRFGARYGRKVKYKLGKIEEGKKSRKCPYCHKSNVKRIAVGIWQCAKCNSKFSGGAYSTGERIMRAESIIEKAGKEKEAEESV